MTGCGEPALTESFGVIFGQVNRSVSGRQRTNGSVLCAVKRASELLIPLYRAVELSEAVLTAPDRPHSQPPGPSQPGTLFSISLSLSPSFSLFLFGRVKEGHCVRHTPALRPPTAEPGPPLLFFLAAATTFRPDAESTLRWLSSVALLGQRGLERSHHLRAGLLPATSAAQRPPLRSASLLRGDGEPVGSQAGEHGGRGKQRCSGRGAGPQQGEKAGQEASGAAGFGSGSQTGEQGNPPVEAY